MSSPQSSSALRQACWSVGGGVVLCLFFTRYFYVVESAAQGDTLWIVGAWCFALLGWAAISWTFEISYERLVWLDVAVGLLVGGHATSALGVIATSGDKRAAANLGWEWVGLGLGWLLLRQYCRSQLFRQQLLVGLVAIATSQAGLGLYQHYVEFKAMAATYGKLFDGLKSADPVVSVSSRMALTKENIPVDGPQGILFQKRLTESQEPYGMFALANTFGGVLAVCLVLAVTYARLAFHTGGASKLRAATPWIAIILLIGWCLLLTKSRTAWIGSIVGVVFSVLGTQRHSFIVVRSKYVLGSLIVFGLMAWGIVRAGGLDRQVLTEAPKSLQYRFQYWSATMSMIRDHSLWGTGLGQFRWNYLLYKLPEASEEIADPHNLLLDVAANGGFLALLGLLLVMTAIVTKFWRTDAVNAQLIATPSRMFSVTLWGIAAFAWIVIFATGGDDRLLVLLPITAGIHSIIDRTHSWMQQQRTSGENVGRQSSRQGGRPGWKPFDAKRAIATEAAATSGFDEESITQIASIAAAIALVVHLCGAGGIGMPGISFLLLGLTAVGMGRNEALDSPQPKASLFTAACLGTIGLASFLGLYWTALLPVAVAQAKVASGDRFLQKGQSDAADTEYLSAATTDLWATEPVERRADLAVRKVEDQRFRSNDLFDIAVKIVREASSRDPANFHHEERLGQLWRGRFSVTQDQHDAANAAAEFRHAVEKYPTSAALMSELAFSLASSGNRSEAAAVARNAIQQDQINRSCGHVDRFLDQRTQEQLKALDSN